MHLPATALALALAAAATGGEDAADEDGPLRWDGRVALAPVWDSNATRAAEPAVPVADEALQLLLSFDLAWRNGEASQLTASFDGGGKLFEGASGQDQAVTRLDATQAVRVSERVVPSVAIHAKDKSLRSGDRDYTDVGGEGAVEVGPFGAVTPRLATGYRLFVYKPDDRFGSEGPFAGVFARVQPWKRHTATVGYELAVRGYPDALAFDAGGTLVGTRNDLVHVASAGWSFKSRLLVSGGYTFARADSNGFGLSSERHRLHAVVGTKLFAGVLATVQGAFQYLRFPDGIYVSQDLLLVDDDENLSSASAKLSRPIGSGFSAEARYQFFAATFAKSPVSFERHVASAGLAYRF